MKPRERKWIFAWEERKRKDRARYCLLPLRRYKESMCKSKGRGSRTRNKKKREQPRGSHLQKKKTAKRELCMEKKIKMRE